MIYLYGSSIVVAAYILWAYLQAKSRKKKEVELIRANWGKAKAEYFPFHRIAAYEHLIKGKYDHELSEQTQADIDFPQLFQFLDRTISKPGQQYLYNKLKHPSTNSKELCALNDQVKFFSANKNIREEVQVKLLALGSDNAYHIPALLMDKLLDRPEWLGLLVVDSILVVLLLLLTPFFPVLALVLLIPAVINTGLHYWNKKNADSFARSFPQLNILINVSDELIRKELPLDNNEARGAIDALKPFQAKLRLLNQNQGGLHDDLATIGIYFLDLIKALFLVEVHALFQMIKELENKQHHVLALYQYVGHVDMAIAVASLREGDKVTCEPILMAPGKEFVARQAYHPLIKNCTPNSIDVQYRSVLITGSNMSGKTTFLRTLMINSILAQTIYTCFAEEFSVPLLKQFSSIRISDDLLEGKSYYFEEINIISVLIEAAPADQNFFVLDEVFKGTNTIERIASAKAILSFLNQGNNIVFVSTHDVELAAMLAGEYDLYHFTEVIENNQLHFDHRLKQGPLTTRNAIRLLELANYPSQITAEASRISAQLSGSK